MSRVFVVGDIHGCFHTLKYLLFESCKITINDRIIFLGDYIDRGPYIPETIELIISLIKKGYDIIPIRGNHEQLFIDSLNNPKKLIQWFKYGGQSTLDAFFVINPNFIEDEIIEFFLHTKYYHLENDFVCVHAGLNFDLQDPFSDKTAMLYSRNSNVIPDRIGNRKLISGHTPFKIDDIRRSLDTNFIRLDGGCVYDKKVKDLGLLVALELGEMQLYYTKNIDFK